MGIFGSRNNKLRRLLVMQQQNISQEKKGPYG